MAKLLFAQVVQLFRGKKDGVEVETKPLVLCKDCKYAFYKEGLVLKNHVFCTKPGTERGNAVKPNDWYCADGK